MALSKETKEQLRKILEDMRQEILDEVKVQKERARSKDYMGDLKELIAQINWRSVPYRKHGSLQSAYRRVVESSSKDDIIVIAGSHYLVGEFMAKHLSR